MRNAFLNNPQNFTLLSMIVAVGLGLAYMAIAGAPVIYFVVQICAVILAVLFAIILKSFRPASLSGQLMCVAIGCTLILTSMFGFVIEGASRWIVLGGISLQPSLLLVPVLIIIFVQNRTYVSTVGICLAALALAIQPDRAMAGTLAGGLAVLALYRPQRLIIAALIISLAAFLVTLAREDLLPAVPFVDQIYYTSFEVNWIAGLAVGAGTVVMLSPTIFGFIGNAENRLNYTIFGTIWVCIAVAAALGNYPTPLVGYSGSAIISYMLASAIIPEHKQAKRPGDGTKSENSAKSLSQSGDYMLHPKLSQL